ncbi:MAG: hypothetical protein DRP03_03185 [Candidatus Aenigmatarchaeota archaeon]|nr:MAG: hypothetical protein DRP03_03185 [Candidatus Aenigmarchaeota archaeon]
MPTLWNKGLQDRWLAFFIFYFYFYFMRIVTLLSDFGNTHYVSEMKAVIYKLCDYASVVDITHKIEKFNVLHGAFILKRSYSYFPKNTVHVAVVDPGVGGERKGIVIKTNNYYFVGPDNGLLSLAAKEDGIRQIVEIENKKYFLENVSATFHGRDIFAPVAAYIARGVDISKFGRSIVEYESIELKASISGDKIIGHVVDVDDFGNLITNIPFSIIEQAGISKVSLKNKELRILKTFCEARAGEMFAYKGSAGTLEIGVNKGSAKEMLDIGIGEKIWLKY